MASVIRAAVPRGRTHVEPLPVVHPLIRKRKHAIESWDKCLVFANYVPHRANIFCDQGCSDQV